MNKLHYRKMVLNELPIQGFIVNYQQTRIDTQCLSRETYLKHAENLTKNEIDYSTKFEVKSSNFYGLPKIHKSKEIQDAVKNCSDI